MRGSLGSPRDEVKVLTMNFVFNNVSKYACIPHSMLYHRGVSYLQDDRLGQESEPVMKRTTYQI